MALGGAGSSVVVASAAASAVLDMAQPAWYAYAAQADTRFAVRMAAGAL